MLKAYQKKKLSERLKSKNGKSENFRISLRAWTLSYVKNVGRKLMSNYKLENMLCSFCNEEHTSVFFLDIRAWFSYCHKVEKVTFTSFSMKETFGLTLKIFSEAFA